MNAEFHYYAVYYLCAAAGFPSERARTIAISSQYVDEAVYEIAIDDGRSEYVTQVTQNYAFWDEAVLRDVYLPFHFVPGVPPGEAAWGPLRAARAASRWTVSPDGPLAKELLVAALRSGDDFRIGIALHAYADGWAHQNFSGRLENGNVVDPDSPLPAVGHLQALRAPDDAVGSWEDPRLGPERSRVVNAERFLQAARKIYRYLRTSTRSRFEDEELVLDPLGRLWKSGPRDARERIADYSVELGVPPYDRSDWLSESGIAAEANGDAAGGGYDKLHWLGSQIRGRTGFGPRRRTLRAVAGPRGAGFRDSPFHRWNEAAREHRGAALALLAREGLI
jgi:hypothetical protein